MPLSVSINSIRFLLSKVLLYIIEQTNKVLEFNLSIAIEIIIVKFDRLIFVYTGLEDSHW